jgi:hypothetical protein
LSYQFHSVRRDFVEIPRSHRALHRLEQRVLADPLGAAEHQRVVDLVLRVLHPVGQPFDDMFGIVAEDFADMVKPRMGLGCVARLDHRWPVEVEAADTVPPDPPAL